MAVWFDELGVDGTGNTLTINKVIYVKTLNKYIAVGSRTGSIPTNTNAIWTSVDGITWKIQGAAQGYHWQSVTWSEQLKLLVAVSDTVLNAVGGSITDQVMTSPDGINWTSQQSAERNAWQDVVWADALNLFVAVANSSGDGLSLHRVMTSPDGIHWTGRLPSQIAPQFGWSAIAWAPALGMLMASAGDAGTTSLMSSFDGINWTTRNAPLAVAARNRGLAWSPPLHMFMLSCGGGNVLRSVDGVTWVNWTGPPGGWNSTLGNQCAWCPLDIVAFVTNNLDRALYGATTGPVFVISAGAGIAAIITSGDGLTWRTETLPSVQSWGAVGGQQPQIVIAIAGTVVGGPQLPPGGDSGNAPGCLNQVPAGADSGGAGGCVVALSPGKDTGGV